MTNPSDISTYEKLKDSLHDDLAEVDGKLDGLRVQMRPLEAERADLAQLIELVERRLKRLRGDSPPKIIAPFVTHPDEDHASAVASFAMTRAKRIPGGLIGVLRELLPAQPRWSQEGVMELLAADHRYEGHLPSAGTVQNNLSELVKEGFLRRLGPGSFELVREADAENPDERGGPNPAIQLDVEKPPDDQLITDRPGHRYGEGSAEAASRF